MAQRRPSAISPRFLDNFEDGASCSDETHCAQSYNKPYEKKSQQQLHAIDHIDHGEGCPYYQEKIELTEQTAYGVTGFAFPTWKKWAMISVIFIVQCSMNMNASLYGNAVDGLMEVRCLDGILSFALSYWRGIRRASYHYYLMNIKYGPMLTFCT